MNRIAGILIFFGLSISVGFSQVPFFQQYNLLRKKENVNVNVISQDKKGFLWIGTTHGLFRFDGNDFTQLTTADSLPDINISAIEVDSVNRIWLGHNNGMISYLEDGKIVKFETDEGTSTEPISDMLFDRHGSLWFSTRNDGLYYYTKKRLYRLDETDGMPDIFIYDIIEDRTGNILAGTDRGLAICYLDKNKVSIQSINYKNGLPDNIIKKLAYDSAGRMWLATEDAGVVLFDMETKQSTPLLKDWNYGPVQDLLIRDNQMWISCPQAGLLKVDLATRNVRVYNTSVTKGATSINTLLQDNEGNIWAGTKTGLFRTPGDALTFIRDFDDEDQNVLAVTGDKNGNIWFSNHHGLQVRRISADGKTIFDKPLKHSSFEKLTVISLYCDNEGYIWAGLYGEGVLRINPATGKVRHLQKELRNGNILSITGRHNVVWLATLGGGSKITFNKDYLAIENFSASEGLRSDFIYQVFIDSKERVWFATDGRGVDMKDNAGFHHFENGLPTKVVYGFAEDKQGNIWLNVQGNGLYVFNGTSAFEKAPAFANIRDQEIHALAADEDGNVVALHDLGLDFINVHDSTVRYVSEESGLKDNFGNLNALGTDVMGDMFFGTSNGIIKYNPQWGYLKSKPVPQIESIKIYDRAIGHNFPRFLKYYEDNLTFSYVGLWFQNPENVMFSYKLENYDRDWISTRDGSATYSKLPPGQYTFKVKASPTEDFNNARETSLTFTINPPFWQTPPFYMVVVVFLIVGAYSFIKYRERKLRYDKVILEARVRRRTMEVQRQNEEIQAQNEEIMAQAEEIKGINENLEMMVKERTIELERKNKALEEYAFINAHKLRSPVASILGLTNLLRRTQLDNEGEEIAKRLQQSADELDDIVRSITKAIEKGERQYPFIKSTEDDV